MVNHFRTEMPMPIVGIGHSFGGTVLCNLALMHPRLISTLVLLDPVIQYHADSSDGPTAASKSTSRREFWASREDAEASFKRNRFYQSWDPRVLEKWCQWGLEETPNERFHEKGIALTTSKHQECFTYLRQGWEAFSEDGRQLLNPSLVPDMASDGLDINDFYRPEAPMILSHLDELRPSALYIFGGTSSMSQPDSRKTKMQITGTGVGGSGGSKLGRVKQVVLDGIGHLVAMEATKECANAAASWLDQELRRFEEERRDYIAWTKKPLIDKQTLSDEWKRRAMGRTKSKI